MVRPLQISKMVAFFLLLAFGGRVHAATETTSQTQGSPVIKGIMIGTGYGLLGGTCLGIASLAFSQNPSKNFRNIAVGASIGLYAGILFGTYIGIKAKKQQEYLEQPGDYDQTRNLLGPSENLSKVEYARDFIVSSKKPKHMPFTYALTWNF